MNEFDETTREADVPGERDAAGTTGQLGEVSRLIETKKPDLVVLDPVLPRADGIESTRTLPALADVPVIFVSAYGGGGSIASGSSTLNMRRARGVRSLSRSTKTP